MTDDRFAAHIKTALADRRPSPSRQLAERLEAAAQRRARGRPLVPAALALAVAVGVLLVVTTRPGTPDEPSGPPAIVPPIALRGDDSAAPALEPAQTPAPAPAPAPAGPTQTPAPAPATPPARAASKIDVRDPLAAYQAVLDGTSPVSIGPAQLAQLRKLAGELASQTAYLAERKRDAEAELARALGAANPDDGRVLAAYDRIAAQDAALGRAQLVARLGARAVLDPDQRSAVEGTARPANQRSAVEGTARPAKSGRPSIKIRSAIPGSVFIDGVRVGETPLTTTVAPGEHELRLDAPGYESLTKHFELDESSVMVLELDPSKRRAPQSSSPSPSEANGRLTLTTKPLTMVYLDSKRVGETPIQLTLTPGRHEIKMVGIDQRTRKTLMLEVTPGQQSNLSFSFDD